MLFLLDYRFIFKYTSSTWRIQINLRFFIGKRINLLRFPRHTPLVFIHIELNNGGNFYGKRMIIKFQWKFYSALNKNTYVHRLPANCWIAAQNKGERINEYFFPTHPSKKKCSSMCFSLTKCAFYHSFHVHKQWQLFQTSFQNQLEMYSECFWNFYFCFQHIYCQQTMHF